MLAAHGVGLEAHAQNSLLVARSGWPRALMLRDFHDSVEYARDYLPQTTPEPDFGPRQAFYDQAPDNQYYRMSNPEALRELVMDTDWQNDSLERGLQPGDQTIMLHPGVNKGHAVRLPLEQGV